MWSTNSHIPAFSDVRNLPNEIEMRALPVLKAVVGAWLSGARTVGVGFRFPYGLKHSRFFCAVVIVGGRWCSLAAADFYSSDWAIKLDMDCRTQWYT
ncbi:unnamed protein product [Toxocara canis]|uniref:Uncharacterized protein n=1 Tax=Toxocara canis TaxID=6265 RepID=A0A183UHA1_TOXCA|nr:unnamed protein product [Toxocara canis]